jgi:flagellar M-ring protein FliF
MIKVPSDQVGKIRMEMAAEGLPKGGSIGYEIFDQKEGFGTTSFVQYINHLRALEGELARTISTMGPIQNARVHLVLPQRQLFSHTAQTATASVFLKTRGGTILSREQVASIQHLIAAAVPQLQPTEISIVDDKGSLLARPTGEGDAASLGGTHEEMRASFEQTQARKIEDIISQSLGFGKVRAQVSAEMDFDKITTSSEIYDPESQVVRSQQSTTEESSANDGGGNTVTLSNDLPGGGLGGGLGGSANTNNRTEETINYEINKTVRSQIRETGQIKHLSVAVIVDGIMETAADGTQTYKPRTEEEMTKIKTLVRSAVNFDETRGDTLEVVNLQFAGTDNAGLAEEASTMMMGVPKQELLRIAETLMLAFIGLMVVLLVVRPIIKRIFEQTEAEAAATAALTAGAGMHQRMLPSAISGDLQTAQIAPPEGALNQELENDNEASEIEKMIDISRVEGRVKASSLRKVGEIVDKHPEEAVSILRNWIYQESR